MSCGGAGGACGGGGGGFGGGGGGAGSGRAPAKRVMVVKDEYGEDKWVLFEGNRRFDVTQPDPNRQALSGAPAAGKLGVRYTYGDELPNKIIQATVCAVICSILGTPLALICMIPMIRKLKKVCLILV